ncbi:hypothetical protein RclHR1_20560001 [Rhizophagus clarus]|uniref:Uncharacterized protein n=1 Tax=Rhizophagus clarus TaxID=94130 RepID=A0A2Z6QTI0_9GLOM|nr:hypothetical protein RclHR1_20560001 [Rhizophagus clarus]
MSSKPLENAPEWALDKMKMYETDETNETIGVSEYDDMVDDLIQSYEDRVPIELNLTEPYSDFLLNSAEMNSTRPEDLDEIGESSTTVWNSISRQTISPELHFEADHFKSGTPLRGSLYDILKVQNFNSKRTVSGTPLGADYDISKSRTPLEADYDISKSRRSLDSIQRSAVCSWIPRRNFEGLGLPRKLQNFEGLRLLDEDFEGLRFSLGAIIFSCFDAFCWIEKVKSYLLELNQLEQCPNH